MRRALRVDQSQGEIVETLRALGFQVESINGIVDLVVYRPDRGVQLVECKTDRGKRKVSIKVNAKTKARQAAFAERFPVVRLTSSRDAEEWARVEGW